MRRLALAGRELVLDVPGLVSAVRGLVPAALGLAAFAAVGTGSIRFLAGQPRAFVDLLLCTIALAAGSLSAIAPRGSSRCV